MLQVRTFSKQNSSHQYFHIVKFTLTLPYKNEPVWWCLNITTNEPVWFTCLLNKVTLGQLLAARESQKISWTRQEGGEVRADIFRQKDKDKAQLDVLVCAVET
jgi:hypothetical protein